MRIITKKRLEDFINDYPDATASLKFWHDTIKTADFYSAQEIIILFKGADYIGNDRIVFNIARNKYRLIVKFEFHPRAQRAYIRFIGTHTDYDKIKDIKNI